LDALVDGLVPLLEVIVFQFEEVALEIDHDEEWPADQAKDTKRKCNGSSACYE